MAAACQSKLLRFFFCCLLMFSSIPTQNNTTVPVSEKNKQKNNPLNVCIGIWNICSMILYIYIFKSTDMLSQILYRGPLLCWLFYFCEKVFSCWECSQKLSQSHKMQERSEEGGTTVFWKGSLITIISATRLSIHSSLPSLSFLPPPSLLSSIFVSC